MSGQETVDAAQRIINSGQTTVNAQLVVQLLDHITTLNEALASQRRDVLLEAADAVDPEEVVDWEEVTEPAGRRHAAEQLEAMAEEQTADLLGAYRARIIREVADHAEDVIHNGDVAEVAAPSGLPEVGRGCAVDARDDLHEDPAGWIRAQARPRQEVSE